VTNGDSDVYLSNGKMIILDNLDANSQVGIIIETTPNAGNTRIQFAQSGNAGDDGCFDRNVLTFPGYILQKNDKLYLVYDAQAYAASYNNKYYPTVVAALAAAGSENGAGGDVVVNPNYTTAESNLKVPADVSMKFGDVTIDGSAAGNELTFNVDSNAPNNIVVTGGKGDIATTGNPIIVKGSDGNDHQISADVAGQRRGSGREQRLEVRG